MNHLIVKALIALAVLLLSHSHICAQSIPEWYSMMKDPNVNYYKAVEAYDNYWEGKKKPPTKELRATTEYQEYFAKMTPKEREEYEKIFLMHKEFRNWRRINENWVKEDGTLMTLEEQQALIDKQNAELLEIEKKNGK